MASTKLFNFRCPSELLQAVEDFAAAEGLTKTEAAAALLRLGLQSQSVVPAPTPKPRKTESETGVRQEGERLTEIESRFESRLAALESRFESRLAALEGQRLGGASRLREELGSLRQQVTEVTEEGDTGTLDSSIKVS